MTEFLFALRIVLVALELLKLIRAEGIDNDDALSLVLSKAGVALGIPELKEAMPELKSLAKILKELRAA